MAQSRGRHPDDASHGAAAVFARLTARQRLVSIWMTAGFSNDEIAEHLGLTLAEVASELTQIAQIGNELRSGDRDI